jgi:hypothetical protein
MDLEELQETSLWNLYEKGRNYLRSMNVYSDTDLNYRMYNGDQWAGIRLEGIEPVQLNFIEPIVKFKVSSINSNLWKIVFNSENYENKEFRKQADKICKMLNKYSSKVWEKDNLDYKIRKVCKDSAINDEGLIYVDYSEKEQVPVNEIINKNDIHYGNENDSEIQNQPYIIIKQRKPVITIQELARANGVEEEQITYIMGDSDNYEEAGESSKYEKDAMCTLLTKMYKKDVYVYFEQGTKYCTIKENKNSGLTLYPVAHMLWEEKKGSARGEGEVRRLIPNQKESNKILMRSALVVKQTAYQQKIVDGSKIENMEALDQVGGKIIINGGNTVDDVRKIISYIQPAQMSSDVERLRGELINKTRELAGAGDIATGQINPESASGKAILAVQQASQQPLIEQLSALKMFIEDIAKIWLDLIITYSADGIKLEEEVIDPVTREETIQIVNVSKEMLNELKASVKVDITPKGAYDKYAQELSVENLLKAGYFSAERLPELKTYLNILEDDANMPKQRLLDAIEKMEEEQRKIAEIEAQANEMIQRANTFINSDLEAQAGTIQEAMQGTQVPQQ